jgi:hypothetical protein
MRGCSAATVSTALQRLHHLLPSTAWTTHPHVAAPVPSPPFRAGEHGGDPKSIEFVSRIVDYVSCSPLRVPIARLAAAQAAIKQSKAHGNDDHCQVRAKCV